VLTRKTFLDTASAALVAPLRLLADHPVASDLGNEHFRLRLHIDADGVWVENLSWNEKERFTANLLYRKPQPLARSSTALMVEGAGWLLSRATDGTKIFQKDSSRLSIEGIVLGTEARTLAQETWRIELDGAQLKWWIERTFLEDCRVLADRFPALVFRTSGSKGETLSAPGASFGEIAGFLDPEMQLDSTRAFLLDAKTRCHEVVSPNRTQEIVFAPSLMALESQLTEGWFSYAKTPADGTSPYVAIGAETVDRRGGAVLRRRGSTQSQSWTLKLGQHSGIAPLRLDLPDRWLNEQSRSLAAVKNSWMGWMFGNNPASVPCLHEMAFFPMVQGIFATHEKSIAALRKQLTFFAETGVEPDGYVLPRWWVEGYYRVQWGNLLDQIPHFILAMYHHAMQTGDRAWLQRTMPVLDRVARYQIALDRDHDGVVEIPRTSGLPNGAHDCSNWYDIIKFGHKDAITNIYCVMALAAMSEMKAWLGDPSGAGRFSALHQRAVAGYNKVFWDDERGFYMDWIDVREKMPESGRRYFYMDQNLLAIVHGVADQTKARRILANLDRRYDELCREFKIPREAIWATPCNMIPITQLGDMVDFGERANQKVYPNYENGNAFFHTTGFEIAARAVAGQADKAYDTFERAMRHGYAPTRFWAASLKWDTGFLSSEPLDDSLLVLWGFLRGCFGVWPHLDGLRQTGKPPRRLEGARYTFCYLGRDVTIEVRNGNSLIMNTDRGLA
jgi:hypothetical protein